jgi:hypothetical protein
MSNINNNFEDDDKFEELINEYNEHRISIKSMINDLEKLKIRIDKLIPDNIDARYMRFFEEKIKAITSLFNSLLDMRKEIAKSIKDEIELRRKHNKNIDEFDLEELIDVRSMSEIINDFNNKNIQLKQQRILKHQNEKIQEDIEIPGLTTKIKER